MVLSRYHHALDLPTGAARGDAWAAHAAGAAAFAGPLGLTRRAEKTRLQHEHAGSLRDAFTSVATSLAVGLNTWAGPVVCWPARCPHQAFSRRRVRNGPGSRISLRSAESAVVVQGEPRVQDGGIPALVAGLPVDSGRLPDAPVRAAAGR
jgi:hypothetical protein